MKIRKILEKRIVTFIICVIFIVLAALYYYGQQCGYPPEPEWLLGISRMYSHLSLGVKYYITELLDSTCALLATKIGGMSYYSARLYSTFLYVILLSASMLLALRDKSNGRMKLYLLPLFALFAVFLFPVSDNVELFQWPKGVELMYMWPFTYHYMPRIYALFCFIIFLFLVQCRERKKQIVFSTLLAAVCLYAMKMTDLIFYTMFLAPLFIVVFLHAIQKAETRKYAVYLMSGGMGILFLSRILPYAFKGRVWAKDRVDIYGEIYGGTNWISPEYLVTLLLNYIKLNTVNFNIQLPGKPVISLYSVVFMFKIAILIAGYIIVFHIIKCSLTKKSMSYRYDCLDEVLAWSYLILSGIFLFTDFGSMVVFYKYFIGLNPIMIILLCRNIEVFPQVINIKIISEIKNKKVLLCAYTFVLCVCSMEKVWTYHAPDGYEADFRAITAYIEITGFGHAVAPLWLSPQVGAFSEGEIMVYTTVGEVRNAYGDDAKIAYIITNSDDNSEIQDNVYEHCGSYEEICEYYSEPTDILNYDKLQLLVFENGIEIKE